MKGDPMKLTVKKEATPHLAQVIRAALVTAFQSSDILIIAQIRKPKTKGEAMCRKRSFVLLVVISLLATFMFACCPPATEEETKIDIEAYQDCAQELEDWFNSPTGGNALSPGSYKVYWQNDYDKGSDKDYSILIVEVPSELDEEQYKRIAELATLKRVKGLNREKGVVWIVQNGKNVYHLRKD